MEKTQTARETIIYELDDSTINKIAAGEVVESPSSVLKELVENAVDAGAKQIRVEVKGGGFEKLCVHDDGQGMRADQLPLATRRHATSKIRQIDDMRSLETMGFRGEALASIASVSRFRIRSCQVGASEGAQLDVEGGNVMDTVACARSHGTSVQVMDLFYNVPARRKFQKSHRGSAMQLQKCLFSMATAYPEIGFTYHYNGQLVLDVGGVDQDPGDDIKALLNRLKRIYSASLFQEATSFCLEAAAIPSALSAGLKRVYGFLCDPEQSSAQRRGQHMVVNRRYVFSPLLAKAVESGYGHFLPQGRKAQFFLFIEMDPDHLDVNVHPQKSQVRFSEESAIYRAIYAAIAKVMQSRYLGPSQDKDPIGAGDPSQISAYAEHIEVKRPAFEDQSPEGEYLNQSTIACEQRSVTLEQSIPPITSDFDHESTDLKREHLWKSRSSEILEGLGDLELVQEAQTLEESPVQSKQESFIARDLMAPLFSWKQWAVWDYEKLPQYYRAAFEHCPRIKSGRKSTRGAQGEDAGQGLLFIYLRRAKARIFYEIQMQKLFGECHGQLSSQRLLIPYSYSFSPMDLKELLSYSEALEKLGLVMSALGSEKLAVHAAPVEFSSEMLENFFEHFLQSMRLHGSQNHAQVQKECAVSEAEVAGASMLKIALMELAKSIEMRQYSTCEEELPRLLLDLTASYEKRKKSDLATMDLALHQRSSSTESFSLPWGMSPLGKEIAVMWGYREIMDHFAKRFNSKASGG